MPQIDGDTLQGLQKMTDRQLIEAYAGGNDFQAFGLFVGRHEGALLSFAAAFLRDETLAQDVVQETFFRAARYPQRLLRSENEGPSQRNWLLKVVRDIGVDNLRRRSSERKVLDELSARAPTSAPAADVIAENREELGEVNAAIDRLRPKLRELLLLKVREKKSYKEIAQITGLTVTNVGFLLHQAMQQLSEGLGRRGS